MFLLLCVIANSACDKFINLDDKIRYDTISTNEKEIVCFNTIAPKTLLLLKHTKDYSIKATQENQNKTLKLAGFYFGPSSSNKIELMSTKSSSFSYISVYFPSECQRIDVSTLDNDQVNFTTTGKLPYCYFHTHKNSTYAVTIDAEDDSILIGLRNGMKFAGKMNDFLRSSSELFLWAPSQKYEAGSENPAPKASVVVGMPNKFKSHHGFRVSINPDQSYPIYVERNHHNDGHGKDGHKNHHHENDTNKDNNNNYGGINGNYSYEYPPKFNYNNIYQNGNIIFPSILYMIICFVVVFLLAIVIVHLLVCCCNRKKSNRNIRPAPNTQDVPPVEVKSQLISPAQTVQPQNVQIIPIQCQQQYPQLSAQPQYVVYPNLPQPQFIQQQPQLIQQQPQLQQQLLQHQPQQQLYYI